MMMPNGQTDIVRLDTIASSQITPVTRVNLEALSDLQPGDFVRAQVAASLPGGMFRVVIRDQPFILDLPYQAQADDVLQLSVVTREPQIKFSFVMQESAPAIPTNLSATAKFITALLSERDKLLPIAPNHSPTPLLTSPANDVHTTATVLRTALTQSGIFYEAHLAQWVIGLRPLAELKAEPQANYAPLSFGDKTTAQDQYNDHNQANMMDAENSQPMPKLSANADTLAIIKQQLEILDSQQVTWQGMIWPKQVLDWVVTDHSTGAPAPELQWSTRLRLTLPRLGAIDANIHITAQGIDIALLTTNTDAAKKLANHRANLRLSLRDAGIMTTGITVHSNEAV